MSSCDSRTVCFKLTLIDSSNRCIPDMCKLFLQHQGFSIVGEWLDNTHIDLNVRTLTMFYYFDFWFCCQLTIFFSLIWPVHFYSRDNVSRNTTLILSTNHKDLLTTNVTKIEVTNSTGTNVWPVELFGHDAGHDLLKVDAFPPSIK